MTDKPKCPCCGGDLRYGNNINRGVISHVLYCPHGNCISDACNQGSEASTREAAEKELESMYEKELAKHPKQ
jgi:hypothetical protein